MGKLYLIPTPVGNMEDITLRALRLLKEVDLVLAEDTRTSAKLLKHYEITTPLLSHHKFNEHQQVDRIAERLERGENIALISDAGTPGISDPGFLLTRTCVERGIATECLNKWQRYSARPVMLVWPGKSVKCSKNSKEGLSKNWPAGINKTA